METYCVSRVIHMCNVTLLKRYSLVVPSPVPSAPKVQRWRYIVPLLYRFVVHIYGPGQVERLQQSKKQSLSKAIGIRNKELDSFVVPFLKADWRPPISNHNQLSHRPWLS